MLYMKINICRYVIDLLLNHWIFFCVFLSKSLNGLDSKFYPVGSSRGGAQIGILRFTMDIFVYKWLLSVVGEIYEIEN